VERRLDMRKTRQLFALFAKCSDSKWLGDVCRALGGQSVKLDLGQRCMVKSIAVQIGIELKGDYNG